MDCGQVNSRALHDESVFVNEAVPEARRDSKQPQTSLEKQKTDASYEEPYPEGGVQAWSVVVGAWFSLFASLGLMNTIAIFQSYTLSHQLGGYSAGTVGWIFSLYTFLAFFCGVYIGPVFDKYGPRWLVIAGTVFTLGGTVFLSFCTEFWQFLIAFGILCGLGSSLLFTPSIASVGHFFKARRGLATGVASTAGGVGGVIYPLMLTSLFDKVGYGWATRVLALICLFCSIMSVLLLRTRLPPAKDATAHPDFRILGRFPFMLTTLGIFLLEFSLFVPLSYIASYAVHEGFSQDFAYHLLPIMNAGSVLGRLLPGYYADVIGPFNVNILAVLMSAVSCFCVWLPSGHTKAGIIVFSVLFGFASGTSLAIGPVCIGRLCRTQEYGRYYATTYTMVSIACLIGIPIAGSVVQHSGGSYTGLIILTGAVYIASLIAFLGAKASVLGWKNWQATY